jgi:hypothetical protein
VITHVAIRAADGTVYALPKPNRHADLYREFPQLRTESAGGLLLTRDGQEQWFTDEGGRFYNRKQALGHAVRCRQPILREGKGGTHAGQLYSEGVW